MVRRRHLRNDGHGAQHLLLQLHRQGRRHTAFALQDGHRRLLLVRVPLPQLPAPRALPPLCAHPLAAASHEPELYAGRQRHLHPRLGLLYPLHPLPPAGAEDRTLGGYCRSGHRSRFRHEGPPRELHLRHLAHDRPCPRRRLHRMRRHTGTRRKHHLPVDATHHARRVGHRLPQRPAVQQELQEPHPQPPLRAGEDSHRRGLRQRHRAGAPSTHRHHHAHTPRQD